MEIRISGDIPEPNSQKQKDFENGMFTKSNLKAVMRNKVG